MRMAYSVGIHFDLSSPGIFFMAETVIASRFSCARLISLFRGFRFPGLSAISRMENPVLARRSTVYAALMETPV